MKVSKIVLILLGCSILAVCTACSNKYNETETDNNDKQNVVENQIKVEEQTEPEEETSKMVQSDKRETEEIEPVPIQLNNTYSTKYGDVNAVTYPKFSFDYPENWKISSEEVGTTNEKVVLSNDRGIMITYSYIGGVAEGQLGGGSAVTMLRIDISKAGDSQFVPGYVQATDHSGLGEFMVAKLKVTGQLDMQTDSDFQEIDGKVAYAVLPESWTGTKDDVRNTFESEFAFWYSGYISMVADAPDGQFTPEEEKEILEILGSFRTE